MQRTCVLWLSCTVVIYFFSSITTVYGKICFIFSNTVKPVLSDIKQDIFLAFQTGGCLLLHKSSAGAF